MREVVKQQGRWYNSIGVLAVLYSIFSIDADPTCIESEFIMNKKKIILTVVTVVNEIYVIEYVLSRCFCPILRNIVSFI